MAITLGKDCTISLGASVVSAKSVTLSYSVRTIDVERYGVRLDEVYPVAYSANVSVEFNDTSDLAGLFSSLTAGTEFTVSGGAGAWSFPAVITGAQETTSVDGVATFTVTAQMTRTGLRGVMT